jgi:SAM-dependent methyltransferase
VINPLAMWRRLRLIWFGGVSRLGDTSVQSSDVRTIAGLFNQIKPWLRNETIVDVGCGKGRVIQWLLANGYTNPIVGIEIVSDVAEKTRKRFARYDQVEVIDGNVVECLRPDWKVFYMFNPFLSISAFSNLVLMLTMLSQLHNGGVLLAYTNINGSRLDVNVFKREFSGWACDVIELNSGGRWDSVGMFYLR